MSQNHQIFNHQPGPSRQTIVQMTNPHARSLVEEFRAELPVISTVDEYRDLISVSCRLRLFIKLEAISAHAPYDRFLEVAANLQPGFLDFFPREREAAFQAVEERIILSYVSEEMARELTVPDEDVECRIENDPIAAPQNPRAAIATQDVHPTELFGEGINLNFGYQNPVPVFGLQLLGTMDLGNSEDDTAAVEEPDFDWEELVNIDPPTRIFEPEDVGQLSHGSGAGAGAGAATCCLADLELSTFATASA